MMEIPSPSPKKPIKNSAPPKAPTHPYIEKEKELVSFFSGLGFQTIDGFFCGGWDALNKRGKTSTILLQEDSVVIVQEDRTPHEVTLPSHLRLPARELLHKEKLLAAQAKSHR
jgi:hypothetical protein